MLWRRPSLGPTVDKPDDMDDEATMKMPSRRPMTLHDPDVETRDHVGEFETAVDEAVDHAFPPECTKMLRDISSCTQLDLFRFGI